MTKSALTTLFLFIFFCNSIAQKQFALSGTIRMGDEAAAEASLLLLPDSLIKVSNDNGFFRFAGLKAGQYPLVISYIGQKEVV